MEAQGVERGGHHAHGVLGLLHVHFGGGVRRDHGHVLFVHRQPQGGVEGLGVGAVDQHVLAHVGEEEAVHVHHGYAAVALDLQRVAQTARCQDHRVGGLGFDERLVHLGARHDRDARDLQLADQVFLQIQQILMAALDGVGEVQQTAQHALLFVQGDIVAAVGRDARRLHAGGAAADDHDFLFRLGRGQLIGGRAALAHDALGQGVDAAVAGHGVGLVAADVAVQAAGAGGDLVQAAFPQLVDVLGIHGQGTGHHEEVDLAVLQRLLEEVGRVGRIHVGDHAAGDAQRLLILGGHVQRHAGSAGVADQQALPMALEVVLGAEARGALDAVEDEVQIRAELGHVVSQGSQTQVHGVGAGGLEETGEGHALLHSGDLSVGDGDGVVQGHEGGVVGDVVVFLNAVDEDLDVEVLAAFRLDLLDPLGHEAGAVFQRVDAVLVGAGVVEAGEKMLAHVEARGVHLDGLEAHLLHALGDGDAPVLDGVDVVHGHLVLAHAELGPLVAQARAVLAALLHQLLAEGQGLGGHLAAVHGRLQGRDALDVDHLHAALGEVHVVLQQLVGEAGQIAGGAGGGLDHAVAELNRADLQRGKEGGEFLVAGAIVAALGIEVGGGDHVVGGVDRLGLGLLGRGGSGKTAQLAHGGDAQGAGSGTLEEIPPGDLFHGNTAPFK